MLEFYMIYSSAAKVSNVILFFRMPLGNPHVLNTVNLRQQLRSMVIILYFINLLFYSNRVLLRLNNCDHFTGGGKYFKKCNCD